MFDVRKKLALAFFFAWVLLFALGATLAIPHVVSPRLETAAREALNADPSLSTLTPHFHGFTGSFTGALASADQLEKAYALAVPALPAGSFRKQSADQFLAPSPPEPTVLTPPAEIRLPSPAAPESAAPQFALSPPATGAQPAPEIVATAISPDPAPGRNAAPEPAAQEIGSPVSKTSHSEPSAPPSPASEAPATMAVQTRPVAVPPVAAAPLVATPQAPTATPAPEPASASSTVASRSERPSPVYVPEEWSDPPPSAATSAPAPAPALPLVIPAPASAQEVDEWTGTVFFATDSSVLQDSQLPILRRVAEDSKSKPDFRLRIISYADPRGNQEFNSWLSRRRAERVRSELAQLGVGLDVELAVDLESAASPILEHPEIQRRVELRYIR